VASPPATAPAAPVTAALWRRLAAMVYDALLLTGVLVLASAVVTLPLGMALGQVAAEALFASAAFRWPFFLYCVAVLAGFHVWFWTHGGQTLGMKVWRIRAVRIDGSPLDAPDALRRYAAAVLSWLPAGLGFWWSLVDPDRLAWHDRLSGTQLVVVPRQPRRS
jgi:uncharacterized RDD family membrane protein YckC